jgi:ABC-2 type transport system permease protein
MYFLLGFFLYALLYAGVGAMCNTIQDSQQFNFPLMMGLVLPMLLLSLVVEAPDSPLSIGLSLFPLFAPVLMFMRVCLQTPPAWQIGLSWLLLLLSIWLAARAAGKLFRLGVLMYGASPTWATLVRALRQP